MQYLGFSRSAFDHCLYFKNLNSVPVFLLLYVDDMLIMGLNPKDVKYVQDMLCTNFDMKDLGDAQIILGIDIVRDRNKSELTLHQQSYVKKVLTKFNMVNAKPSTVPLAAHFILSKDQCPKTEEEVQKMHSIPYSNAIGSVMYLMVSTRPDIAYSVSCLSRYMSNPGQPHWEALKWLLRYLKHTSHYGLHYSKCTDSTNLCGFVDSNYANDRIRGSQPPLMCLL